MRRMRAYRLVRAAAFPDATPDVPHRIRGDSRRRCRRAPRRRSPTTCALLLRSTTARARRLRVHGRCRRAGRHPRERCGRHRTGSPSAVARTIAPTETTCAGSTSMRAMDASCSRPDASRSRRATQIEPRAAANDRDGRASATSSIRWASSRPSSRCGRHTRHDPRRRRRGGGGRPRRLRRHADHRRHARHGLARGRDRVRRPLARARPPRARSVRAAPCAERRDLAARSHDLADTSRELESTLLETIETLNAAVEARDPYTAGHSQRVRRVSLAIGRELRLPARQLGALATAALFHDIGKIGMPDSILTKPEKLDRAEAAIMREHVTRGAEIVSRISSLKDSVPGNSAPPRTLGRARVSRPADRRNGHPRRGRDHRDRRLVGTR